jgi:hypothetical protein
VTLALEIPLPFRAFYYKLPGIFEAEEALFTSIGLADQHI